MLKIENEYQNFSIPKPVNRQYKDRLFRVVFRDRKDLLDLYNAVNGTDYQNADELLVTTLEDVIYLGMKNDISFMIGASMNLYEQQSTWNENMPLRGLIYFAGLYQAYIARNRFNLYGSRRILLPAPHYIVFYNGKDNMQDRTLLKLSDAFVPSGTGNGPCLECQATIFNINQGHNPDLLEKCRRLKEYTEFVAKVRNHLSFGKSIEEAIGQAIRECLEQEILVDVLTRCRTEVLEVLLTEYNEEETREYLRQEAIQDGLEQGLEQGLQQGLKQGLQQGLEQGLQQGLEQGLQALIETCQELNLSKEDTLLQIARKYTLDEKKAQEYLDQYWK